ncbi:MAG: hypothetical protein IKS10_04135 [Lachnospiraceae bacterium]|nr:hypothetical protein [Lachnospiraceae bacterium]
MKFKTLLFISFFILLCLTGCGDRVDSGAKGKVEDNPLSEEEIIKYVKDYMYSTYKDEVEVQILGKNDLKRVTEDGFSMDGSYFGGGKYVMIKNGHSYPLEITFSKYNTTVHGIYEDGYTLTRKNRVGSEEVSRSVSINYYDDLRLDAIIRKAEFEELLGEYFTKFHIYEDPTSQPYYNIYLYSTDYEKLNEALNEFAKIGYSKYPDYVREFHAFIFKDEEFYDSFDFDKCNNIDPYDDSIGLTSYDLIHSPEKIIEHYLQKNLTLITTCEDLDQDIFTTNGQSGWEEGTEEFDHVLFMYWSVKDKGQVQAVTYVYGINMENVDP